MADEALPLAMRIVRGIQADGVPTASTRATPASRRTTGASADAAPEAPTAFLTWAHRHSSWDDQQAQNWQEEVATFAATLRHLGVDADVDLFHLDEPQDWTRFGQRAIQRAQFTLIIMSAAWAERWAGSNAPTEGAGAAGEADYLRGLFAKNQETWQRRLLIVMFPEVPGALVPPDLERVSRVYVDPTNTDDYEAVLRNLTAQPRYPKPPLGVVPRFTPAQTQAAGDLREELKSVRAEMKALTADAPAERRQRLTMRESALLGFIDAADQGDD
ncbi:MULTISPECIES: SEFIR domain-containing protein [unclassified Curtobacterium]|uniref:SEFIR domain-containing protein n=1 Tax=unclassified Curtobacterium TaxID=257496 RepID=UPI0015E89745|nr:MULTISPECIES: SEFIR domain-containing protein [unclassified Curtobacterium]